MESIRCNGTSSSTTMTSASIQADLHQQHTSVEDMIERHEARLSQIQSIFLLMINKKHLVHKYLEAYHLLADIDRLVKEGGVLMERGRGLHHASRYLSEEASKIVTMINRIKDNLPDKFNKLPSDADESISDNNNHMNNSEDRSVSQDLSCKRQIQFGNMPEIPQKSATKNEIQYLTRTEFNSIPGYMRGRMTYDLLNAFIDKFNKCLVEKYAFLLSYKKMTSKKRTDIDRYEVYRRSRCPKTQGKRFVTTEDLKSFFGGKLDKQTLNMFPMLRHTNRIQEIRDAGIVRYAVCEDSH